MLIDGDQIKYINSESRIFWILIANFWNSEKYFCWRKVPKFWLGDENFLRQISANKAL